MDHLTLLPRPRHVQRQPGWHELTSGRLILLAGGAPDRLLTTGKRLRSALLQHADVTMELSAAETAPADQVGIELRLRDGVVDHDQGYELTVDPDRIRIEAATVAGVFYGVATLVQVLAEAGSRLPCGQIRDWPDFPSRGVMLDISRDKVPTMATLLELVDRLAGWKINQIQLYTEHTFAYRNHTEVWADASPMTGEDILELDAFCAERFIELVPNQNTFGHMHRWLTHERYAHLAEVQGEFTTPWGTMSGPFSLAPTQPGSLELVRELLDELLPHFSSRTVNVGCDETFDLGQGRSREECEHNGTSRVYLDFVLGIHREVAARGHRMMFWGDIVEKYADLIPELPPDVLALAWGYEADHPFAETTAAYADAGVPFYVCPGTSAWCSVAGRTKNALGNLRSAAENGLRHGASGYLITDWGDRGHWQVLPVSYLGLATGAAYSWAFEANQHQDMAVATSYHAFADQTGTLGQVAYDLGNVYTRVGLEPGNSSVLFWLLQLTFDELASAQPPFASKLEGLGADGFRDALGAIDDAMGRLDDAQSVAPDAELVRAELLNTARMLRHACKRQLYRLGAEGDAQAAKQDLAADLNRITTEYRRIWERRNRPGGLADSVGRLERLNADYA